MKRRNPLSPLRAIAISSAVSMELGIFTVGGFYLGRFLDRIYNTAPLLTAASLVLGIMAGGWSTYMLLMKVWNDDRPENGK